jgi:alpha-L-rhamnosidase
VLTVDRLRVNYLTDPVGIDDRTPTLSWRLTAQDGGHRQTAYQLQVATGSVVWYTIKTPSDQSVGLPYHGPALRSRQRLTWRVRVWDEEDQPSGWSAAASWEMGLLDRSDWTARWVTDPRILPVPQQPLVIRFPAQQVRYVRLNVTRLGKPLQEGWPAPVSRLQLAELQVFGAGTLRSQGKRASASEAYRDPGVWGPEFLTDGTLHSNANPRGYTSLERHTQDLAAPIWVEVDLGSVVTADEVRLYPRTDTLTPASEIANFPENFTIEVRDVASGPGTAVFGGTGQQAPAPWLPPPGLPLLARAFTLDKPVSSARLYTAGLGISEVRLNGNMVGDAVLEPGYTDFRKRVLYTTHDVSNALQVGQNTLGAALGYGVYDVKDGTGRYTKFTGSQGGPLKLLAQLEVTHPDGTRTTIGTDGTWRAESGPTTFTNWFGGEDHDARRELPGWDAPGANHQAWRAAQDLGMPTAEQVLSARETPPVRIQETITAAMSTEITPGLWLYDLGRNVAGWPEITLRGAAGQTAMLRPSERLVNGRVNQTEVGAPVYFRFTPATGDATWHPRFMYYGFRYVEVSGVAARPELGDVRARVLRASNTPAGGVETSNSTLNSVYQLVKRAVASNMFSVLTDCPHREKLGWLEEYHLLFDTIAGSFDVAAYYRKLARDIRDAQLPNGMVPDIAPEYTVFADGFRDEPNWGGALIMVPYKHFRVYGDAEPLSDGYAAMNRYMDYLASRATDHVLSHGLGDWGAFDKSTPLPLVVTSAYYRYANVMAEISAVLGQPDTDRYRALAADIHTSFNATFYDETNEWYGSGSQASNALPLAEGLVPDDRREQALAALKANIEERDGHLSTGEVGLRALFDVLGESGDVDTVLTMALNPTAPSYAAMLASGATTLPEFWDGTGSQNHFMMGAIYDWSIRYLAGIRPVDPGFRRFAVTPTVATSLTRVAATWDCPYGQIASAWRKTGTGVLLTVVVPVNTQADIHVPSGATGKVVVNGRTVEGQVLEGVGAGTYEIEAS